MWKMAKKENEKISILGLVKEVGGDCNVGHVIIALGNKKIAELIPSLGYAEALAIVKYCSFVKACGGCDLDELRYLAGIRCKKLIYELLRDAKTCADLLQLKEYASLYYETVPIILKKFEELFTDEYQTLLSDFRMTKKLGFANKKASPGSSRRSSRTSPKPTIPTSQNNDFCDIYERAVALCKIFCKVLAILKGVNHGEIPHIPPKVPISFIPRVFQDFLCECACVARGLFWHSDIIRTAEDAVYAFPFTGDELVKQFAEDKIALRQIKKCKNPHKIENLLRKLHLPSNKEVALQKHHNLLRALLAKTKTSRQIDKLTSGLNIHFFSPEAHLIKVARVRVAAAL